MDENQSKLELDPSVMLNQTAEQDTESIDSKYNVNLFASKEDKYTLYDYDQVQTKMYSTDSNYTIDVDTDKLADFYTEPAVYPVATPTTVMEYTNILLVIVILQICVIGYFGFRIYKVKGAKNEKYNV